MSIPYPRASWRVLVDLRSVSAFDCTAATESTPPEATRALLSVERFDGPIWEPACGLGHISNVLTEAGNEVVSTDLI
ncbi:MAG: hypothetical protein SFW09_21730 [Hyphomicrobiaceae bacterium]|nr:hypothetical protein [Hyphomicrobiaceae bacterium]